MSEDYTEEFTEQDDIVTVVRNYPLTPSGFVSVEMYLTKAYVYGNDRETIKKYLDHTATAYLTREGFTNAD